MGFAEFATVFLILMKFGFILGIVAIIWAISTNGETGENLWFWIPVLLLFPFIGAIVYIFNRIRKNREDARWEKSKMEAHSKGGARVSRRVTSEKELTDQYHRGKGMRD